MKNCFICETKKCIERMVRRQSTEQWNVQLVAMLACCKQYFIAMQSTKQKKEKKQRDKKQEDKLLLLVWIHNEK